MIKIIKAIFNSMLLLVLLSFGTLSKKEIDNDKKYIHLNDSVTIVFFKKDSVTPCEFLNSIDSFGTLYFMFKNGPYSQSLYRILYIFEKNSGYKAQYSAGFAGVEYYSDSLFYVDILNWMRFYKCDDTLKISNLINHGDFKWKAPKKYLPPIIPIDSIIKLIYEQNQ